MPLQINYWSPIPNEQHFIGSTLWFGHDLLWQNSNDSHKFGKDSNEMEYLIARTQYTRYDQRAKRSFVNIESILFWKFVILFTVYVAHQKKVLKKPFDFNSKHKKRFRVKISKQNKGDLCSTNTQDSILSSLSMQCTFFPNASIYWCDQDVS